ncbi:histone-lysine n-methyltransferase [Diaporthe amygdali]|uniref:histone-lysine n-methyltransferase n=1 Tax=Phomopsis amygdali TaxID=1214568 RepID=UPI0022FF3FBA|nr:histone-lysine n-methyltransferase [Diaporthe amygdali]KAJ0120734.1 histone-lysine n-methyltransferase [Diaporthe amygdali]
MDTRSVVRSRRRSARLTGQSPQDGRVKQSAANKRRDSDHGVPAKAENDAPRRAHSEQARSISKDVSSSAKARSETPKTDATKVLTKSEDSSITFPLSPNLHSPKEDDHQSVHKDIASTTTSSEQSADGSSVSVKANKSTRWFKTDRASAQLANDASADSTKSIQVRQHSASERRQEAPLGMVRRRSRRLASMTPDEGDVERAKLELETKPSQAEADKNQALSTKDFVTDLAASDAKQQLTFSTEHVSTRVSPDEDRTATLTGYHGLPTDRNIQGLSQSHEFLEDTSPIPELVADIEKIINSSPMASQTPVNGGTEVAVTPIPTAALKKRGLASVMTRSRALRNSQSLVENPRKNEKLLDSDSESSQLDGAFDDSIRGRRQKQAIAARPRAKNLKTGRPRGTKRRVEELSQNEETACTPQLRRSRQPGSDESNLEVDLSSANAIETATSRDAFSADAPSLQASSLEIGDLPQGAIEPANSAGLARPYSTNPERMDIVPGSTPTDDGSESASAYAPGQSQNNEDVNKCADCGRAPARYLVCAKCLQAIYCGKYCQIWNWPVHKARCHEANEADPVEIETQERYLGDMWAAALRMLEEEKLAGGTLESLLLGEAVGHSPAHPTFMGQETPDVHVSHSTPVDSQAMGRVRAMSLRLAQASQGS